MDVAVTSEQARETVPIDELTRIVIACCYKVHAGLGFGFLESVYKRALVYEMGSRELLAEEEVPLDSKEPEDG